MAPPTSQRDVLSLPLALLTVSVTVCTVTMSVYTRTTRDVCVTCKLQLACNANDQCPAMAKLRRIR